MLSAVTIPMSSTETGDSAVREESVRYRTVGDMAVTGAIRSEATTVDGVLDELTRARWTERARTRADDDSPSSLEDRKREGYF